MSSLFDNMEDTDLVEMVWAAMLAEREWREKRSRLEMELTHRMESRGAKEIFHAALTCVLETPSPAYDTSKLRLLAELLGPDVLKTVCVPEHEDLVTIAEKWDGRVLRTLGRKYGNDVSEIIEGAKVPGGPARLKIGKKVSK